MNTIKKIIRAIIAWTWELPQNLIGGAMSLIFRDKAKNTMNDNTEGVFHHWRYTSGLSLGIFRFVGYNASSDTMNHEYGHSRQSLYLGPLYLIVIGLPSLIWCGLHTYTALYWKISYYWFYTEAWADKLGKVKRN